MYQPPRDFEIAFTTSRRDECRELRLVLDAAGIRSDVGYRHGDWCLSVHRNDLAVAEAEVDAYRQENPDRSSRRRETVPTPVYGGATAGVLVYAGILFLVAFPAAQGALGHDWYAAGRMHSGSVMSGQWWRTVTALTLHADVGHIGSNLAFGAVFGFLAGRILGGGVAWLAIVLAGALGNFVNAMVQAPTHSSIGASTAVFGALGVIVSHSMRSWGTVRERLLRRWSPLIGGVLLFAMTGLGDERTDVVAHVTGLLAGLLIGWLAARLPHAWLASGRIQIAAGLTSVVIVGAAWMVALVAAR